MRPIGRRRPEEYQRTHAMPDLFLPGFYPTARLALLTVKDAARLLHVSTATVYKLCATGALPHVRVLNAVRIAPTDVEAFIAAQR